MADATDDPLCCAAGHQLATAGARTMVLGAFGDGGAEERRALALAGLAQNIWPANGYERSLTARRGHAARATVIRAR